MLYKRNTPWKETGPIRQARNSWSAEGERIEKVNFKIIEMDEGWRNRPDLFRHKVYIDGRYVGSHKTLKEAQHAALNP